MYILKKKQKNLHIGHLFDRSCVLHFGQTKYLSIKSIHLSDIHL